MARYAASAAGAVGVVFLGIGFLIAIVSYFHMRLEERERLERMEYEELRKSRGGSTLFQEAEADTFAARRSREQFERYLVPLFTGLLCVLQGGAVWWAEPKHSGASLDRFPARIHLLPPCSSLPYRRAVTTP